MGIMFVARSRLYLLFHPKWIETNGFHLSRTSRTSIYKYSSIYLCRVIEIPAMIFNEDGFLPNFDNLAEPDVFYIVESSDCYTATLFKGFDFGHHTKDDGSFQAYDLDTRNDDFPPEVCIEIQPDQRIMILSQAAVSRIPVSSAPQSIKDRILALGGLQGPTPLTTPQDSFSFDKGSHSTSSTERTIHNTHFLSPFIRYGRARHRNADMQSIRT